MIKIVVLSLNTLDHLKKCLSSVRKYTARGTYHLHIIDQGSTDGSQKWLKKYYSDKPDVILDLRDINKGIYIPWWEAYHYKTKRAEYDVVFLGSDTEVQKDWLDELQECAYSDPMIGIVSAKLLKKAGKIPGTKKQRYFVCFGGSRDNDPKNPHIVGFEDEDRDNLFEKNKEYQWVTFSCVFVKADCLNDVGFFDFHYRIWCGDRDYCYTAQKNGWKSYFCGKSRVLHDEGMTVRQFKKLKNITFEDGEIRKFADVEKADMEHFAKKWSK
jgi:GT2 family glycosyltransferase